MRREWDPNRRRTVALGSRWKREGEDGEWVVVEQWNYEMRFKYDIHALTIENEAGDQRHMSQAHLITIMREVKS